MVYDDLCRSSGNQLLHTTHINELCKLLIMLLIKNLPCSMKILSNTHSNPLCLLKFKNDCFTRISKPFGIYLIFSLLINLVYILVRITENIEWEWFYVLTKLYR